MLERVPFACQSAHMPLPWRMRSLHGLYPAMASAGAVPSHPSLRLPCLSRAFLSSLHHSTQSSSADPEEPAGCTGHGAAGWRGAHLGPVQPGRVPTQELRGAGSGAGAWDEALAVFERGAGGCIHGMLAVLRAVGTTPNCSCLPPHAARWRPSVGSSSRSGPRRCGLRWHELPLGPCQHGKCGWDSAGEALGRPSLDAATLRQPCSLVGLLAARAR